MKYIGTYRSSMVLNQHDQIETGYLPCRASKNEAHLINGLIIYDLQT